MKNKRHIQKLVLSAMLLAIAYVLPTITGGIQQIGNMLCPMHIPVILCGFICGPVWGAAVGAIAPIFRSLTLHMPVLFPIAVCMAFELAAYGLISGLMYKLLPKKLPYIYCSLLSAMIMGRIIWGAARFICAGLDSSAFGLSAFLAGALTSAVPGIIIQLILIPLLVAVYQKLSRGKS